MNPIKLICFIFCVKYVLSDVPKKQIYDIFKFQGYSELEPTLTKILNSNKSCNQKFSLSLYLLNHVKKAKKQKQKDTKKFAVQNKKKLSESEINEKNQKEKRQENLIKLLNEIIWILSQRQQQERYRELSKTLKQKLLQEKSQTINKVEELKIKQKMINSLLISQEEVCISILFKESQEIIKDLYDYSNYLQYLNRFQREVDCMWKDPLQIFKHHEREIQSYFDNEVNPLPQLTSFIEEFQDQISETYLKCINIDSKLNQKKEATLSPTQISRFTSTIFGFSLKFDSSVLLQTIDTSEFPQESECGQQYGVIEGTVISFQGSVLQIQTYQKQIMTFYISISSKLFRFNQLPSNNYNVYLTYKTSLQIGDKFIQEALFYVAPTITPPPPPSEEKIQEPSSTPPPPPLCALIVKGQCKKCVFRAFFNEVGICEQVDGLCREWNEKGRCTSCYEGYNLKDGQCVL